ncbi:hypothetical protein EXIGLDRAFT_730751 [Exidia glandulosa HHB12029]|uniref:Uncharacterized protein n=1 Tax=Exidia glandulosa HHB12029 TaxID=1314781 RepID=A0A165C2S7_EXIGL|nr:hypothetical protein EXIGLDRAFT_730751 [Exidia glandulosa HHB12029]
MLRPRRRQKPGAPISRIPTELLVKILVRVVRNDEDVRLPIPASKLRALRLAILLVCKTWRDTIYRTPAFWASHTLPSVTTRERSNLLAGQLARAGNALLRIELDLLNSPELRACGGSHHVPALLPHTDKIVALDIRIHPDPAPQSRTGGGWLLHAQTITLPRLIFLRVANDSRTLPVRFVAPRLRELHLSRIDAADWDALVGRELQILRLESIEFTKGVLLHVLARCSGLRTLQLKEIRLVGSSIAAAHPFLPNLQKLECTGGDGGVAVHIMLFLFRIVPWHQLDDLKVDVDMSPEKYLAAVLERAVWTGLKYSSAFGKYTWCLREIDGRVRWFKHGYLSEMVRVQRCVPDAFSHLVELCVDCWGFIQLSNAFSISGRTSIPSVVQLVMELGRETRSRSLRDVVMHLRGCSRGQLVHLQLPALRRIFFVFVSGQDNSSEVAYLSPTCVDEFISFLMCREKPEVLVENVVISKSAAWKERLTRVRRGVVRGASVTVSS